MEYKIRLKNIQLFGFHGVDMNEKKNGQQFEIDVEADLSLENAIKTDDIYKTKDYSAIYDEIVNVFFSKKYNLIETLASKIASSLTEDFSLSSCKVAIRKPNALIKGVLDTVEVEVIHRG